MFHILKKIVCIYFFILTFFMSRSFSLSIESLFRNGSNPEVEANYAKLVLEVKELDFNDGNQIKHKVQENSSSQKPQKMDITLYFFLDADKNISLSQLVYLSKGKGVDGAKEYFNNFKNLKNIFDEQSFQVPESSIFYSLIGMFTFNREDYFISSLKRYASKEFFLNKDMINLEKDSLFRELKIYLKSISIDSSIKEVIPSPLKGEDRETQQMINNIFYSNYIQSSESVSFVRKNKDFYIKADLGNFIAYFTNDTNRLDFMQLNSEGTINVNVRDYTMVDGVHVVPKLFFIKTRNERYLEMKVSSMKLFTLPEPRLRKIQKSIILKNNELPKIEEIGMLL